ncbi:hypothetical protein P3X46_028843 [Hevea brasiliensis]|uniref:Holliday junction resolvase RuvC n=2 Tax=Hevea brasiliensis TaxID=3981 RepID=A0ABQ9KS26_HEVBR|nr:hypothetical protein P3X46_028843 [Hevea brasiliensis]
METLKIRTQSLQSPKPQFMNSLFSRLKPNFSSIPSLSCLKPFCTTNPLTSSHALRTSSSSNSSASGDRVRVRANVAEAARRLKEDWLDSLSYPYPDNQTELSACGGADSTQSNVGSEWAIGIDPDISGALALLKTDESGCSAQVFDAPYLKVLVGKRIRKRLDAKSIVQLLRSFDAPVGTTAYIEQSIPYPKDGKQGWWSGGFGYGLWIGMLVASGYSVVPVPSVTWKNEYELSGSNRTKDDSRRVASTLFPSLSSLLTRKKDHGRAEALLIAAYGKGLKLKSGTSCILDELP